MFQLKNILLGL